MTIPHSFANSNALAEESIVEVLGDSFEVASGIATVILLKRIEIFVM